MAKMTREAAIELLKNRKVYVNGQSAEIQKKLFQLGWTWADSETIVRFCESPFLYIESDMRFLRSDNMEYFAKYDFTEISAEEILSIEVAEPLKENDIVVSGWDEQDGRHCEWIAVVNIPYSDDKYTAKVLMFTIKDVSGFPDIKYDAQPNSQQWTRPATEEEKQKLIDALKQEDSDDARKVLKEVFGIEQKPECPFKPFDKVLVRENNTAVWKADFFSHYNENGVWPYGCCSGYWQQCIPYENNEHLRGTTNNPETK